MPFAGSVNVRVAVPACLGDGWSICITTAEVRAHGPVYGARISVVRGPATRLQCVPDWFVVRPVHSPHGEDGAVDMLRYGKTPSRLRGVPPLIGVIAERERKGRQHIRASRIGVVDRKLLCATNRPAEFVIFTV